MMSYQEPGDDALRRVLQESKTVAVVGLSNNPARPSYRVASYLKGVGYRIVPVNPAVEEVLGEKAYPSLEEVPGRVDVVDVFRRSEEVPPVAEAAIRKGARTLWLQEGIINQAAADLAQQAGLFVVMDRCMLKEHARLL